jgi:hypothetical protein
MPDGKRSEVSRLIARVACVALIVCIVFPLGELAFPVIAATIGDFPFTALEAVVTTTLGFGLFEALFG